MAVRVQAEDFDPGAEMAAMTAGRPGIGALVSFTGLVRGAEPLELEHWPGVTETALAAIEAEARARWPLEDALVIHRFGALRPGDRIVLVLAASAHRQAAFEAAAFLMDYLKTRAPFWKKEGTGAAARWVAARESDAAAEARWG